MPDLFFFGTLCHVPLLETVIGHDLSGISLSEAAFPDHQIHWATGHAFPLLVKAEGQQAVGLLARGLSDADVARLVYYEEVFNFDLIWTEVVEDGVSRRVQMFWPPESGHAPGAVFRLEDWAPKWGDINTRAAVEVMRHQPCKTAAEVGAIYGMIHVRAAAFVAAQRETPVLGPSGMRRAHVESRDISIPYANFFAMEERHLRFRRFDGSLSAEVDRAIFMSGDAALVLPYDPVRDRVLLVEQVRMGPLARGDHGPWQLEPIAGRVDPGEAPEEAARREAQEEAGLTLTDLQEIHQGYPSPGASSEFFYTYLGLADLPDEAARLGGVDGEHEDIKGHVFGFATVMAMLDRGDIRVGPLALALHWLARNRESLRRGA
ncbi:NUDIX domain-containing protein [Thalassobius sp. Cn5-15]|uniref:NUDIX domain-containing protein n=1 Tax=Thalassobius sp. Cn5-15 TaxID=2917763 RepID=UPI001EF1ADBD|nr:NUDIX domain-containing protein [Thalassobius sp. Cn5-15]MCG7492651.1 NUDIX domain-containing protein [Thalassobius sp. Cn5-15]